MLAESSQSDGQFTIRLQSCLRLHEVLEERSRQRDQRLSHGKPAEAGAAAQLSSSSPTFPAETRDVARSTEILRPARFNPNNLAEPQSTLT
jgi:hypothetical protein